MDLPLSELLLLLFFLLLVGAFAGVLAGLLGVGGGIVIVGALFYVFSALDYPAETMMHVCVATSLATIVLTSIRSLRSHWKRGAVDEAILKSWAPGLIFGAIVVRVFVKLIDEENIFYLLASAGLATQFAIQALINMAVNLDMAPSKGMTLPFISYGGSSLIALSIGFGLLLAFTRRNPHLPALDRRL